MTALQPDIILQGRAPNILGAMAQGMQLRAAQDEMLRQNALGQLTQRYGAGLVNGDPAARNAMAAYDPALVMNMDAARTNIRVAEHGMQYDDARLEMAREEVARQAAEAARQMSAEQRTQAAEALQRTLTGGGFAFERGPEQFGAWVAQHPELEGVTYETWPMHAAEAGIAAETISGFVDGPGPEYREFGGNLYDMNAPGGPGVVLQAPEPEPEYSYHGDQWWQTGAGQPPVAVTEPPPPDPAEVVGPNGLDPKQQLDAENAFRDDWTSLPEVKDYSGVTRAYSTIVAAAQQESGAGDIALITMLGKLLDPQSVVREQEFAIAANAGGTLAWLQSQADRVANGQLLTPDTRAQIVAIGTAIQREAEQRIGGLRGQYEGIATRAGMDPMDVMPGVRYSPTYRGAPPFAPVARPQSRPGSPGNAPPPTNQIRPTGQLSQGTQGTGAAQGSPATQGTSQTMPQANQPATQAGPITIPSPNQVARMDPSDLDTLVRSAAAAGVTIPRDVRDAIRARLMGPSTQGGN